MMKGEVEAKDRLSLSTQKGALVNLGGPTCQNSKWLGLGELEQLHQEGAHQRRGREVF
jgi:hypothetical protein